MVYYAEQQLCTCITLFCTFLYRPCTNTTWKCLIASFMEDANKRRRISFSLSRLQCGPQEINSREIRLHFPFSANWNKRDKDWKKKGIHFKTDVFAAVAVVDAKTPYFALKRPGKKSCSIHFPSGFSWNFLWMVNNQYNVRVLLNTLFEK